MSTGHLFVDISAHGFGHLAQTAPILNALAQSREIRLTLRSSLSQAQLARRIQTPFVHIQQASDFGFVMHDALSVNLEASAERYRNAFNDWPLQVANEAQFLADLAPDLVLSNISALPLAGAVAANIPTIAMCSLNWADLFAFYFGTSDWAAPIHAAMHAAYAAAKTFMVFTPGTPMESLNNRRVIGPVSALGLKTRSQVAQALRLPEHKRWLLIALGGIAHRLPIETWPELPGIEFLVPDEWQTQRGNCSAYADEMLPFADLLPHVDVVLTKPGYGMFTEAACSGLPVLYLPRPDWPESPYLEAWLQQHARTLAITPQMAASGDIEPSLHALLNLPAPIPPKPTGIADALRIINRQLDGNDTIAA